MMMNAPTRAWLQSNPPRRIARLAIDQPRNAWM